ncbi:MAG: flagellar motor protein MotA [Paenibacillaceae bacterium ZCTH02-B3]|nr:MAG: flagellar motor protein MotA [Paenibacillaceae bacterium ZCTH02-B3]
MRRFDASTALGIIAGIAALAGGFLWEGGHLGGLVQRTGLLIVFGGTFAAVAVSFPVSQLKKIPEALRTAFYPQTDNVWELIDQMAEFATAARREGVLSLEPLIAEHPNEFLREGLQMVVDGTDPQLNRQILEVEIDALEERMEQQAKIFEAAGGYAPTMGIIGTVMGLIHVLSNLSDPGALGPAIAVAFTATLYGVASANVLYLPIASKIRARIAETVKTRELILEGILSIQAGENPWLIRKKLMAFMLLKESDAPQKRVDTDEEEA